MTEPLSTLLSRVLGKLTDEAEAAAGDGVAPLAVWANVLRCIGEDGLAERDLAEAARISKRLAAAAVTTSSNHGWITADPAGGKNRTLRLTDAGRASAQAWPPVLDRLDAAWRGTPLRAALEDVVGRLPFELPHFPAAYGTADPSAVGGPYMQQEKRKDDGVPAHGTDWRPAPRGEGDTVSSLPVTSLLAQALTAFTIDYEDRFPWPLHSTATVLVHIGPKHRPLSELPEGHGITGKGKSLLERHLIVSATKAGVALTDRGELVLKHHPARLDATEALWRERSGDAAVDALRAALEPLAADAADQPAHLIWSAGS